MFKSLNMEQQCIDDLTLQIYSKNWDDLFDETIEDNYFPILFYSNYIYNNYGENHGLVTREILSTLFIETNSSYTPSLNDLKIYVKEVLGVHEYMKLANTLINITTKNYQGFDWRVYNTCEYYIRPNDIVKKYKDVCTIYYEPEISFDFDEKLNDVKSALKQLETDFNKYITNTDFDKYCLDLIARTYSCHAEYENISEILKYWDKIDNDFENTKKRKFETLSH